MLIGVNFDDIFQTKKKLIVVNFDDIFQTKNISKTFKERMFNYHLEIKGILWIHSLFLSHF